MERLTLFWIVHVTLLSLFTLEMLFVMSIWLRGRVPGLPANASPLQKVWTGAWFAVRLVFSRRFWRALRSFVSDGLVQQRVLRRRPRHWAAHIAVYGSFVILGILSTVTGLAVEIFPNLLPPTHFLNTNWIAVTLRNVDHPLVAVVNDILGLAILVGLGVMFYRRYVQKDSQLRTGFGDTAILVLLAAIVLSGFPLEAFRLLADHALTGSAAWGFTGYLLASAVSPFNLDWDVWYNASFWAHFVIVNVLLFYAPFSRFTHVLMSPIIVTFNVLEEPGT